jgi:hypothetical protein
MVGVVDTDAVLHDTPQPTNHNVRERARRSEDNLCLFIESKST